MAAGAYRAVHLAEEAFRVYQMLAGRMGQPEAIAPSRSAQG
jgi:hypothetical protein